MNAEPNLDRIISMVKKLLALAGNNPNEKEAASAAEKASALMAEYNLSMAAIDATNPEIRVEEGFFDTNGKAQKWGQYIWGGVCKLNFCYYYISPKNGVNYHMVIGTRVNVISTEVMAQYLVDTTNNLAIEARNNSQIRGAEQNAFKLGVAVRLRQRLIDLKEQRANGQGTTYSGTTLPVLADLYKVHELQNKQQLETLHPGIRLGKNKGSGTKKHSAYQQGKAAGDTISLNQQMGRTNRQMLEN